MGNCRPLFSLFLSLIQLIVNKICRWMDSNLGPLELEATTLPTEPLQSPSSIHCFILSPFRYQFVRYFLVTHFCLPVCPSTAIPPSIICPKMKQQADVKRHQMVLQSKNNFFTRQLFWFSQMNDWQDFCVYYTRLPRLRVVASVTRFGEIPPLWQIFKILWQFIYLVLGKV